MPKVLSKWKISVRPSVLTLQRPLQATRGTLGTLQALTRTGMGGGHSAEEADFCF